MSKESLRFTDKVIKIESEKDLPEAPLSQGFTLVNKTGSWRNVKPQLTEQNAPCQNACPLKVWIQSFIDLLTRGNPEAASLEILKNNPFPLLTRKLCKAKCEIACNRKKYDFPVSIRELEGFIGSIAYEKNIFPERKETLDKRVAVIGNSEAVLSAAYFLYVFGIDVDLYTVLPFNGLGLSDDEVEREIERLKNMGIKVFQEDKDIEVALTEYDAVITDKGEVSNKLTFQTDNEKLYVVGVDRKDFSRDLYFGKRAAKSVFQFLKGVKIEKDSPPPRSVSYNNIVIDYFEPEDRIDVINTMEDAIKEGNRCFSCGHCNSCGNCYVFCPDAAISWVNDFPVVDYDYCKGCGICVVECPRSALILIPERG